VSNGFMCQIMQFNTLNSGSLLIGLIGTRLIIVRHRPQVIKMNESEKLKVVFDIPGVASQLTESEKHTMAAHHKSLAERSYFWVDLYKYNLYGFKRGRKVFLTKDGNFVNTDSHRSLNRHSLGDIS
jgi:hypothetical protein